ncbi:MAG: diacylglycerol/lipid kinase family protein [Acidimicrobiales bacterium]
MAVVHLLVNPAVAGNGRGRINAEVADSVAERGHEVIELRPPSIGSVAHTIDEARADGLERLIIVGGDGLVHRALPAVAGSLVTVGIVPVGTGNDFARAVGLHRDLERAVVAALSDAKPIDLIAAGDDRWAASVVTGGFSADVNALANRLRFPSGQKRYTLATLLRLPRLSTTDIELVVDGQARRYRATLFAIANTRYFGGGMAICPDAVPDDGLLDVTIVGPTSAVELARMLPTVFSGRHVDHPAVVTFRGAEVKLKTSAPVWADGEPFVAGTYRSAPGALRLAGSLVQI